MALNRGGALAHDQTVVSAGNDGGFNRSTHLSWRRVPSAALADAPTRRLDLQLAPTRRAKRRRPEHRQEARRNSTTVWPTQRWTQKLLPADDPLTEHDVVAMVPLARQGGGRALARSSHRGVSENTMTCVTQP